MATVGLFVSISTVSALQALPRMPSIIRVEAGENGLWYRGKGRSFFTNLDAAQFPLRLREPTSRGPHIKSPMWPRPRSTQRVQADPLKRLSASETQANPKSPVNQITCDAASRIISGYAFSDVKAVSCFGGTYQFEAMRDAKPFSITLSAKDGELIQVKKTVRTAPKPSASQLMIEQPTHPSPVVEKLPRSPVTEAAPKAVVAGPTPPVSKPVAAALPQMIEQPDHTKPVIEKPRSIKPVLKQPPPSKSVIEKYPANPKQSRTMDSKASTKRGPSLAERPLNPERKKKERARLSSPTANGKKPGREMVERSLAPNPTKKPNSNANAEMEVGPVVEQPPDLGEYRKTSNGSGICEPKADTWSRCGRGMRAPGQ